MACVATLLSLKSPLQLNRYGASGGSPLSRRVTCQKHHATRGLGQALLIVLCGGPGQTGDNITILEGLEWMSRWFSTNIVLVPKNPRRS